MVVATNKRCKKIMPNNEMQENDIVRTLLHPKRDLT